MTDQQKILAIIPARGGSKRIPRKNIVDFCDKAMLAWPLQILQGLDCIGDIIVSTDDPEIADIAKNLAAKVPFMRPDHLANDHATTIEVIQHAVDWYQENIGAVDYVLTVYPTAVFLTAEDIVQAVDMLKTTDTECVFAGTEFPFPIQRAVSLSEEGLVRMIQPEHALTRSQDLTAAYHDAGQFYAMSTPITSDIFAAKTRMVLLPRYRVVDIDTHEDLQIAQGLFQLWQQQK